MIISSDENKNNENSNQLDAKEIDFDKTFEGSIRPKTFDDYIGQSELKETLAISIKSAQKREQSIDHMLFYGPPGLGKTTLAGVIANEMGVNIKITSAPALLSSSGLKVFTVAWVPTGINIGVSNVP